MAYIWLYGFWSLVDDEEKQQPLPQPFMLGDVFFSASIAVHGCSTQCSLRHSTVGEDTGPYGWSKILDLFPTVWDFDRQHTSLWERKVLIVRGLANTLAYRDQS